MFFARVAGESPMKLWPSMLCRNFIINVRTDWKKTLILIFFFTISKLKKGLISSVKGEVNGEFANTKMCEFYSNWYWLKILRLGSHQDYTTNHTTSLHKFYMSVLLSIIKSRQSVCEKSLSCKILFWAVMHSLPFNWEGNIRAVSLINSNVTSNLKYVIMSWSESHTF